MMFTWLASAEWARVVQALLHTLWEGVLVAAALGIVLQRTRNPQSRYRWAMTALSAVLLGGLITWAAIMPKPGSLTALVGGPAVPLALTSVPPMESGQMVKLPSKVAQQEIVWTAWLALGWVAGLGVMLVRAGVQVAGAERLRRSSWPTTDAKLQELFEETRRAVRLARRVRLAVTDQLTSPAVAGLWLPTLIVPLTLTTTLSPEQIRLVFLHELAHIRRGDYLANLFQMLSESILFFNPAVWWISRQIRVEREACCDAEAMALGATPTDYAQTLLSVAENGLRPVPAAALAVGGPRHSSLLDRVQRVLVPGYRPSLRLSWRAMLVTLLATSSLLILVALGTQATLAVILTPQQRIDHLEKKMTEYGENPEHFAPPAAAEDSPPRVAISGHVRSEDGSPLPRWLYLSIQSCLPRYSSSSATYVRNGVFSNTLPAGDIYITVQSGNYAPTTFGPLDGLATNRLPGLELVLQRGYDVAIALADTQSGQPVAGASLTTMVWFHNNGMFGPSGQSGPDGRLVMHHCADLPVDVTVSVPGYEITKQRFEHERAGESLHLALRHGSTFSGVVLDRTTGQPIADAAVHLLYAVAIDDSYHGWIDPAFVLAHTDAAGRFTVTQLRSGVPTYLGITAAGHEGVQLNLVTAGQTLPAIQLGPELVVHGRLRGPVTSVPRYGLDRKIDYEFREEFENGSGGRNSYGDSGQVPIQRVGDEAEFTFTNRCEGPVSVTVGDHSYQRDITGPVTDWVIDMNQLDQHTRAQLRDIVLRFQHSSGVPPRGTVGVTTPNRLDVDHSYLQDHEVALSNGEVHVQSFVGFNFSCRPGHLVGYWFDLMQFASVPAGNGPWVIDVPVVPAGNIYAQTQEPDGTTASDVLYAVEELKRSSLRQANDYSSVTDGQLSETDPGRSRWISGPLPLRGTYQIVAWRGKQFAVSHEITLTESEPDAEVTLNFAQPQSHTWLVTDEEGHPLRAAEAKLFFNPQPNHSFELNTYYTDGLGSFTVEGVTPTAGKYSVRISASGYALQELDLNFRKSDPGHIELKPGLPISGRVVDSATGYPLPHAKVQVWGNTAGQQMPQETTTDENGAFSFTTLSQGSCEVRVNEARFQHTDPFGNPLYNESHQAGETNLILRVVPEKWGQLKPKAPETNAPAGAPKQETSRAHHRQRTGSRGEHFV